MVHFSNHTEEYQVDELKHLTNHNNSMTLKSDFSDIIFTGRFTLFGVNLIVVHSMYFLYFINTFMPCD